MKDLKNIKTMLAPKHVIIFRKRYYQNYAYNISISKKDLYNPKGDFMLIKHANLIGEV